MSHSDIFLLPIEDLEPGMALEVAPGIFWDVVSVAFGPDMVHIELVHGRECTMDPDATVVVER